VQRTVERDLVPMARAFDLGICAWAPLGGGLLTGKYAAPDPPKTRRAQSVAPRINERSTGIVRIVTELAAERGVTAAQVALAWVTQRGPDVIPILGAKRLDQLKDNLGALELRLTPDDLKRLDTASDIDLGFPHQFLKNARTGSGPVTFFGVATNSIQVPEGGIT
jgi:aryl-alcohol dehydrogenase-like predicted oxidoreductase